MSSRKMKGPPRFSKSRRIQISSPSGSGVDKVIGSGRMRLSVGLRRSSRP